MQLASAPPFLGSCAPIGAAMLSQAGLWAQTFLLTGLFMDALNDMSPLWYRGSGHYGSGLVKGAVYSGVFMGLIHAVAGFTALPTAWGLLMTFPPATAALVGALAFPLLKTIIESFDGDNHFFKRLASNYTDQTLFLRGAVTGIGVGFALQQGMVEWNSPVRWLYGCAVGAAAYAVVDLLRDTIHISGHG